MKQFLLTPLYVMLIIISAVCRVSAQSHSPESAPHLTEVQMKEAANGTLDPVAAKEFMLSVQEAIASNPAILETYSKYQRELIANDDYINFTMTVVKENLEKQQFVENSIERKRNRNNDDGNPAKEKMEERRRSENQNK